MNAQTKIEPGGAAVYAKIAAVQGELAKTGISKNNANTQQNYKFRGIDDVYNALAPLLAKHGLCVLPRILNREMHERVTVKDWNGQRKESVLFYVTVEAEFDFVSAEDGSFHTVRTFGEAMDSGDKATNKAMSAAYKYAAFMAFAIPTEGDNDADAAVHEIQPAVRSWNDRAPERAAKRDQPFPQGPAKNKTELKTIGREFWREVEGCGDELELTCLLSADRNIALLDQIKAALPSWWDGYEKDGEQFPGLAEVITKKQNEFAAAALNKEPA